MDWTFLYAPDTIFSVVVGGLLGYFFYRLSSKKQKFSYTLDSATLMDKRENEGFRDIEIRFQDKNIDKLTVTKLTVWNSGNTAISKDNVAPADPLRLSLKKAEILNCRIVKQTDERGKFEAQPDSAEEVRFSFDYFDPNDGFKCEIIHTGEEAGIKLCAKIIGSKKSIHIGNTCSKKDYVKSVVMGIITIIMGSIIIISYLCNWWILKPFKITLIEHKSVLEFLCVGSLSALYILMGIIILYRAIRGRMPIALQ